ncbi:MAG: Holliday junction helicase subunit RuvA [Acidimicrobiales bacterium]|nr:Holliday junction helicase subunit RuvA [Acidimicrobiales bacterium]
MIGSLRGVLLDRSPTGEVTVEVGGVGYRAVVAPRTLADLGELGSPVFLYTHLHVREDAMVLYGFITGEERVCFEALIGAHGVGPALALAILSVHTPSALRRALFDDDVAALTLVPGVGKKTAARLLIDLKTRLEVPDLEIVPAGGSVRADLGAALAGLGYQPDEVREVLRELPGEGNVDVLLRDALKLLATSR